MMIAIIDSGVGNVQSVSNALEFLKIPHLITTSPLDIKKADKLIFPGQGAFCDGMKAVNNNKLIQVLKEATITHKKPYLGICLGLQLLAEIGYEDGEYKGMGLIPGIARKISTSEKLPHIGWNDVSMQVDSPLFSNLPKNPTFYFAHSYVIEPKNSALVTTTCTYGEKFVASIAFNNIYGVQFHPEKSQKNGLQLLKNFVNLGS